MRWRQCRSTAVNCFCRRQVNKHRWGEAGVTGINFLFASLPFPLVLISLLLFPSHLHSSPICPLSPLVSFGLYISPSCSVSLHLPSSLLKKIERETWRESGISLIATVTRLMERLLDYRWASAHTRVHWDVIARVYAYAVSVLMTSHRRLVLLSSIKGIAWSWEKWMVKRLDVLSVYWWVAPVLLLN